MSRPGVAPPGLVTAEDIQRIVLPNGLPLLSVDRPGSGMIALHLVVRAGALHDGDRAGLARFVASTIDRGTKQFTSNELGDRLDGLGATLAAVSGVEAVAVFGRALAEDAPDFLRIAADVVTAPVFPAGEVEKTRGELLTDARVHAQDTRYAAERAFRALAFPPRHPHARPVDGDEAVLQSIGPRDLVDFHDRRYRPGDSIAILVGDLRTSRAQELMAEVFGGWERPAWTDHVEVPSAPRSQQVRRDLVALAGKSQTDLVLGGVGVPRLDPEYYAAMLATLVVGQMGMMGRIGERVREQQGLAYYAYMELRPGVFAGPWWVRAGVHPSNVQRAVDTIVDELSRFQQDGPTPEEVADARSYLTGSLALRVETHAGLAAILAEMEYYGLGLDYLERFPAIVAGVTPEAMISAVRRLPVDAYALGIAGPPP